MDYITGKENDIWLHNVRAYIITILSLVPIWIAIFVYDSAVLYAL